MVIPRDIFKDFWIFWFFLFVLFFQKKTDRNFWPRVPLERFVAPLWDLVCCFIMAIPRDIFKDFLRFWFFAVFEKKKQLAIFGPTCHLNDLSKVYETWYAASLWQYFGIFSRIFWKFWIFFDFCCFSKKQIEILGSPTICTICRSSMKIGILIYYVNTSGSFQGLFELLVFINFGVFPKKNL